MSVNNNDVNFEWYDPVESVFIQGISALKNRNNQSIQGDNAKYESCVYGSQGQIWEYNENTLAVLVYGKHWKTIKTINALAINKKKNLLSDKKSEHLFLCSVLNINAIKAAIKVPVNLGHQITLAKRFRANKHLD